MGALYITCQPLDWLLAVSYWLLAIGTIGTIGAIGVIGSLISNF